MASLLFAHKFKTPMAANSLLPALVTVPGTPEPEVDAAFATPSLHSTVEADAAAQRRPTTHAGEAGRNKSSVAQVTDPDDTQSTGREEKTTKSIQKPAIKNAKSASKTKQQHEVSFTPNSRQNGKKADDKPRRGELRLEDEDDDDASNAAAVAATTKRKKAAPEDQKKKTTKAKAMLAAEKQKEKKAAERARSREAKRRFINDGDDDEEDDAAVEEVEVADASDADEVDQDQALDEGGVFDLGAEDEEEEAAAAAAAITSGDDEDGDDDDAKQTDNDFDRKLMSSKRARRAPSSHGRRNGDVFQSDVLDVVNESGDDDDDDGPKSSRKSKNKSKKRARDTDGAAAERRASKSKRRSSSAAVDGDDDAEVEDTFDMNVVLQQNAARFKLTTRREGEPMTTQSVRKVVTKAPRGGAPVKINYRLIQCDTYQRCGYSKKELMQVNTSRALRVFPTNFLHFAPFNERGKYDIDDIISFFVEKNGTMTAASRKFLLQLYYLDFQKNYSAFCEFYGRVPEYIEIIRSFDFPPVPPQLYVKKERKGKGKGEFAAAAIVVVVDAFCCSRLPEAGRTGRPGGEVHRRRRRQPERRAHDSDGRRRR